MRLGVQQHIEVFPWIPVEDDEAGALAHHQLPEEKPGARVHGDVARLDDELIFGDDDQLASNDEEVDANVFRGCIATDQPGVRDDDPIAVRGNARGREHRHQQDKAGEQRGPHRTSIYAYPYRHSHCAGVD